MTDEKELEALMKAYDWQSAMVYAKFKFEDIARILLAKEGEGDGPDWELLVELRSGDFGALWAWCDYSGWGCQEGGGSGIFKDEQGATKFLEERRNRYG